MLAAGARRVGQGLWQRVDVGFIDGVLIDGSARGVGRLSGVLRMLQSGYLYWYALVMILGLFGLLTWQLWPHLASLFGA